jgi:hypothetical protein
MTAVVGSSMSWRSSTSHRATGFIDLVAMGGNAYTMDVNDGSYQRWRFLEADE